MSAVVDRALVEAASAARIARQRKPQWGVLPRQRNGVELGDAFQMIRPQQPDHVIGASRRAARWFSPELKLRPADRMIMGAVTFLCGNNPNEPGYNQCWATEHEIGDMCGLDPRTLRRRLAGLSEYIRVKRVWKGGKLPRGDAPHHGRLVITIIKEPPEVDVKGIHGSLALAFDKNLDLKASRRAVMAVFLIHEAVNGWSFPSVERVAAATGSAKSTAATAIRELVALRHLQRERPRDGGSVRTRVTPRLGPKLVRNLSGQMLTGDRPNLATKEILQGDPLRAAADQDSQLALPFGGGTTPRTVAVQAVLEAHQTICKAPAGDGSVEAVTELLNVGVTPDDLEMVCRVVMMNGWRRERLARRSVASIMQTKGQVLSFIERVDPERAKALELRPLAKTSPQVTNAEQADANDKYAHLGAWDSPAWKAKRLADVERLKANRPKSA